MTASIGRLMSIGVATAMVCYCCWPYVFGPGKAPGTQVPGEPPALAASLLSPSFEPRADRDPFQRGTTTQAVAAQDTRPASPGAQESDSDPEEAETEPELNTSNPLAPLALSATYIRGHQRVALINGRIYAQGDRLEASGTATQPYVVAEIQTDKVLIERKGRAIELTYPDLNSTSNSSPRTKPNPAVSKPARAATSAPAKRSSTSPSSKAPNTKTSKVRNAHE